MGWLIIKQQIKLGCFVVVVKVSRMFSEISMGALNDRDSFLISLKCSTLTLS